MAVLAVLPPDRHSPQLFLQTALPFGAASSVIHFNRAARSLQRIVSDLLSVPWVNYFDDYP
eukprot:1361479-Amphidinium_carterae.1